jgi:hypothetical protein
MKELRLTRKEISEEFRMEELYGKRVIDLLPAIWPNRGGFGSDREIFESWKKFLREKGVAFFVQKKDCAYEEGVQLVLWKADRANTPNAMRFRLEEGEGDGKSL